MLSSRYHQRCRFDTLRIFDAQAPPPSDIADKYVLRFEVEGHRDRLKQQAANAKRSLNKQILLLIEAGERVQQASALKGIP